jgi:hypothetical protein
MNNKEVFEKMVNDYLIESEKKSIRKESNID